VACVNTPLYRIKKREGREVQDECTNQSELMEGWQEGWNFLTREEKESSDIPGTPGFKKR